ncbi:hypothetical protein VNO77_27846 [Canavalia gladiata]|uniref:Uncharacterized protein n=1 Tax=Canavalia gladiata TaxID=3824 RepID=A0AAN9KY19_CANGL
MLLYTEVGLYNGIYEPMMYNQLFRNIICFPHDFQCSNALHCLTLAIFCRKLGVAWSTLYLITSHNLS